MHLKPMFYKKYILKSVVLFTVAILTPLFAQSQKTIPELEIRAKQPLPGKMTIYNISFIAPDTLTARAFFALSFPKEFDLEMLEIADSRIVDGGLEIGRKDRRAEISRSGLGKNILPETQVEIEIGLIQNPSDLSTAPPVTFILKPDGGDGVIYSKDVLINFQKK